MNTGELLSPLSLDEFAEQYFERRLFYSPRGPRRLSGILEESAWDDLLQLLTRSKTAPIAWLADLDGGLQSIEVTPAEALALYDEGATLYFDADLPRLRHAAEEIADATGRRRSSVHISIFATRNGGTRAHFDVNENITIQVRGSKTWWVARNEHVSHPTCNWVTGAAVPAELALYARLPLPGSMPETAQCLVMEPGSLIYVPSGMWHETRATAESLSININFTLGEGAWIDLFLPIMEEIVNRHEELRRPAKEPPNRKVLDHLCTSIEELGSSQIFGRQGVYDGDNFRRNQAAFVYIADGDQDEVHVEIGITNRSELFRCAMTRETAAFVLDIAARDEVFSIADMGGEPARPLLRMLTEAGLLIGQ